MSLLDQSVVLVTGASAGIGRELARMAAKRARALVIVARRRERLEELARELARDGLRVEICVADLASASGPHDLVAHLKRENIQVDVLINNAGVGDMSLFDLAAPERLESMIQLNVTSLVALTRALVPSMVARGRGGILNIGSGFGLAFLPAFATYIGTKFFVTGFSEALRADLAGTGVHVTLVCPGPVTSEFQEHLGNFTGRRLPSAFEISAARCASVALSALERNRARVIPGFAVHALLALTRCVPTAVNRVIARLLSRPLRRAQIAAGTKS